MSRAIINFIDLFYPPFKRLMPLQTFRYAACGGGNTLLALTVFFVFHEYVFKGKVFDFGFYAFKPYNAALMVSFWVSFTVGFLLMKYVVFLESNLKGRIQLFRYFITFTFNLCLNYLLLKLFVEKLSLKAMPSQIITTCIIVAISYISQKHFSFKAAKDNEAA